MSTAEPTPAGRAAHAQVLEAEHELEQATSARPHDPTRLAAALEHAVDACRRWPEAASGVFYLPELLGELSEAYEQLGRTEDALDTMQAAITAGYTGAPDPRCRLAEILLRAGRADEAHPIFAEVKADTPDDVWLYHNAGLEYGAVGDHERALAWLTDGLELALSTGDPEPLVAQMNDLRWESLTALGRQLSALVVDQAAGRPCRTAPCPHREGGIGSPSKSPVRPAPWTGSARPASICALS
jgi:tetratricopeptide (TPR) repeat protein